MIDQQFLENLGNYSITLIIPIFNLVVCFLFLHLKTFFISQKKIPIKSAVASRLFFGHNCLFSIIKFPSDGPMNFTVRLASQRHCLLPSPDEERKGC